MNEQKKTEWLQKCWCQEGRKDREKRECDEMMNLLAVGMQWVLSPCSETTPPPYGSGENFKHMPSAAAFLFCLNNHMKYILQYNSS